jgi:hypothetical protein
MEVEAVAGTDALAAAGAFTLPAAFFATARVVFSLISHPYW